MTKAIEGRPGDRPSLYQPKHAEAKINEVSRMGWISF
jgi:hypothetical protein